MRKKIALISIILVLLFCSFYSGYVLGNTNIPDMTYYEWEKLDEMGKLSFTLGYILAKDKNYGAIYESIKSINKEINQKQLTSAKKELSLLEEFIYGLIKVTDYSNIRVGQLKEGIDDLYSDYKNKNIAIVAIIRCARDLIKGRSRESINKELQFIKNFENEINEILKK